MSYPKPEKFLEFEPVYIEIDNSFSKQKTKRNPFYKGMTKDEILASIEGQKKTYPERLQKYKQEQFEKARTRTLVKSNIAMVLMLENANLMTKELLSDLKFIEKEQTTSLDRLELMNQRLNEEISSIPESVLQDSFYNNNSKHKTIIIDPKKEFDKIPYFSCNREPMVNSIYRIKDI